MHQIRPTDSPKESPVADLYQRHARQSLASIRPRVDTQEDAEDLLVEVFLAIMQNKMPLLLIEDKQLVWLR